MVLHVEIIRVEAGCNRKPQSGRQKQTVKPEQKHPGEFTEIFAHARERNTDDTRVNRFCGETKGPFT